MDCSPPGSSVHGIFQARVLEWGAVAFSVYIHCCYCYCYVVAFADAVDEAVERRGIQSWFGEHDVRHERDGARIAEADGFGEGDVDDGAGDALLLFIRHQIVRTGEPMLRVFRQGDGMVADDWREDAVSDEIVKFFQQFVLLSWWFDLR